MTELRAIDPRRTALLVQDMHVSVAGPGSPAGDHAAEQDTVANIGVLLTRARELRMPVIHVHHRSATGVRPEGRLPELFRSLAEEPDMRSGAPGLDILPGIEPVGDDIVIHKERFGAFTGTGLDMILRAAAVDTIIVTGTYTNLLVESTARHGADSGYRVVLPEDSLCSVSKEWHEGALEHGLSIICEIGTTVAVAAALDAEVVAR